MKNTKKQVSNQMDENYKTLISWIILFILLSFALASCTSNDSHVNEAHCEDNICTGDIWRDIGKPDSYEYYYKIIKIEDGYVFDEDYTGVIHRFSIKVFKENCILKKESADRVL